MSNDKAIEAYVDWAEKKGSKVIENLLDGRVEAYKRMPNGYGVDFLITGKTGTLVSLEIKDRRPYKSEFVDTVNKDTNEDGQYLELIKYNHLTGTTISGYTPMFCAIYDDYIVFWDIMTIKPIWETKILQANNYYKNKKPIKIHRLHLKESMDKKYETKNYTDTGQ